MLDSTCSEIPITRAALRRIFSKIKVSDTFFYKSVPCWEWQASIDKSGYGKLRINGIKTQIAHRAIYSYLIEPTPQHLVCDHLCRTRHCVNPAHMDLVPQRTNIMRGGNFIGANIHKTHCHRGHSLQGDNLILQIRRGTNKSRRQCRTCNNDAVRRYRQKL